MSATVSAREAALERRIEDINGLACTADDGVDALRGLISKLQDKPLGAEIDTAIASIDWIAEHLHRDLSRIADLGDEIAVPLEPEELAEAAE